MVLSIKIKRDYYTNSNSQLLDKKLTYDTIIKRYSLIMINEVINALLEVSKISPFEVGQTARTLSLRTKYYKNIILQYSKSNDEDSFYQELIKLHTKLVRIEASQKDKNHMIHDTINFIERLINKKMKKEY